MTPIAASTVQAMASIFHPFVSLCFHCTFVPGHIASRLNIANRGYCSQALCTGIEKLMCPKISKIGQMNQTSDANKYYSHRDLPVARYCLMLKSNIFIRFPGIISLIAVSVEELA